MEIENFAEIEAEFIQRAHDAVWCSAATVDARNRPRSRILHPIWEGQVGWIATGRRSHKAKHLVNIPYVSLAYLQDPFNPLYVDCQAEWLDDINEKQRIWDLYGNTAPPLGYDLTPFFQSVDHPAYGLLRLSPWRIELATLGGQSKVWRA